MMRYRNTGPILAIEDGDEDYEFMQLTFARCGITNPLLRLADGDEALGYLESDDGLRASPAIILLDLNLPGADGRDLLQDIRRHPRFAPVPIVVLSTSNNPRDVRFCYAHGANCYVIKPVGLEDLERTIAGIAAFWLDVVELPGRT